MPKRWCLDCPALITAPATRCGPCQAAAVSRDAARRARSAAGRGSSSARGYGSVYKRRRDRVVAAALMAADAGEPMRCGICRGPMLRGQPIVAHHPDSDGVTGDPATVRLVAAHKPCNDGFRPRKASNG